MTQALVSIKTVQAIRVAIFNFISIYYKKNLCEIVIYYSNDKKDYVFKTSLSDIW